MPTKRTRRARGRRAEIPADLCSWLADENPNYTGHYFLTNLELRAAWAQVGAEILETRAREQPGTRPHHWWLFDAPRQPAGNFPECYYDGKLPEPRHRLGGTGTPAHEVLANVPNYSFGIPTDWVSKWQADYYNGRRRDIHGKRIGTEYHEGHFAGLPIDPSDPPTFESEASYLQRLGLLLPGEFERLSEDDFQPEAIEAEADPEAA